VRSAFLLICTLAFFACTPVQQGDAGPSREDGVERSDLAKGAEDPAKLKRIAKSLAARNDADALMTAAIFYKAFLGGSGEAFRLADRATGLAPNRPELVFLELQLCDQYPTCDVATRAERLQKLDPGNAARFYSALNRAHARSDVGAEDAVLLDISRNERFDIYLNVLVTRMARALTAADPGTGKPLQTAREAATLALGAVVGAVLPSFSPISDGCKGERLQRPDVAQACRGVARVMEKGDTVIVEAIGQMIGLRAWPGESEEARAIIERRRIGRYQRSEYGALQNETTAASQEWLELVSTHRREQEVIVETLRRHGRALEPPADWREEGSAPK